jgi:hypothetical protein
MSFRATWFQKKTLCTICLLSSNSIQIQSIDTLQRHITGKLHQKLVSALLAAHHDAEGIREECSKTGQQHWAPDDDAYWQYACTMNADRIEAQHNGKKSRTPQRSQSTPLTMPSQHTPPIKRGRRPKVTPTPSSSSTSYDSSPTSTTKQKRTYKRRHSKSNADDANGDDDIYIHKQSKLKRSCQQAVTQQGGAQRRHDRDSHDGSDNDYEDQAEKCTNDNITDIDNDMEAEASVSSHTATTARYVNVASFTPFRTKSNRYSCDQRDCAFTRMSTNQLIEHQLHAHNIHLSKSASHTLPANNNPVLSTLAADADTYSNTLEEKQHEDKVTANETDTEAETSTCASRSTSAATSTSTPTHTPTCASRRTRQHSDIPIRFCAGDGCTSELRSVEDYFCSNRCAHSRGKHKVYDKFVDSNATTPTTPTPTISTNTSTKNRSTPTSTYNGQAVGISGNSSSTSAVTAHVHDPFQSWRNGDRYLCNMPKCQSPQLFLNDSTALKLHMLCEHNIDLYDYEKQWAFEHHLNQQALSSS